MENLGYVKIDPDDVNDIVEKVEKGIQKFKTIQQIKAVEELERSVLNYRTQKRFKFKQKKVDEMGNSEIIKELVESVESRYGLFIDFKYGDFRILTQGYGDKVLDKAIEFLDLIRNLTRESYLDIETYKISMDIAKTSLEKYEAAWTISDNKVKLRYWENLYNEHYKPNFNVEMIQINL